MSRSVAVVILCEGIGDANFLSTFLSGLDGARRRSNRVYRPVRISPAPSGSQSGEQFVREHIAHEAKNARRAARRTVLVVHSDADKLSVVQRTRTLEERITPPRTPDEPIAIIVPRRNTETWLRYLSGEPVNEDDEVAGPKKSKLAPELARSGGTKLAEIARNNWQFPPNPPPSLVAAREEFQRVLT